MVGISHLNCVIVVCVELAAAAKSLHSSKFLFLSIFIFLNNYFFFFSERDEIVRPTIVVIFDSIAIIFSILYFSSSFYHLASNLIVRLYVFPGLFRIRLSTQVYHLNPIYIIILVIIITTAAFFVV